MAVSLVSVKCPECGATLEVDRNRKECFCTYCGNKMIIDDGSRTFTHVYVDQTKEKELEVLQNKQIMDRKRNMIAAAVIGIAIITVMVTFIVLHDDFNITFNYSCALIAAGTAIARIGKNNTLIIGGIVSFILIFASIAFIVLKDDFNTTFMLIFVIALVLHGVVTITRNLMN